MNNLHKLFLLLVFLITPASVNAAEAMLYFSPSTGTYSINEEFTVSVKADTAGETVNAGEGTIGFDKDSLEVVRVSKSGSLFSLWTIEPSYSNTIGTVNFGGGVPSGYSGPGGSLIGITFKAKRAGPAQIRFVSGAVLANDGKGSNILRSLGAANYNISPQTIALKTEEDAKTVADTGKEQVRQAGIDYNVPNIWSETHPNQNKWSNSDLLKLAWELPSGAERISIAFDKEPGTVPGTTGEAPVAMKEYRSVDDGIWYFHLRFKDAKGWGGTAHYRAMIDSRPPSAFTVAAEVPAAGDWPVLKFQSADDVSGLDRYEIFVGSLEHQSHVVNGDETSLKLSSLSMGKHTALVKATDKAGNERISSLEFYIDPIERPSIVNYSKEVRSGSDIFLNGKALPGAEVRIYAEREGRMAFEAKVKADASGDWFFASRADLANGRYAFWAEAVNDKGLGSAPSDKAVMLISPPIFMVVGDIIINYFTVVISLLFAIFLLVFGAVYLSKRFKKKGRKESTEAEAVLIRKLADYQELIDNEFEKAKKAGLLTDDKMHINLKKKLREAEKGILKEVRDVEGLFKV